MSNSENIKVSKGAGIFFSTKRSYWFLSVACFFLFLIGIVIVEVLLSDSVNCQLKLGANIGKILHYDEVLTMSAQMAAHSQDKHYQKRYIRFEALLSETLEETFGLVDSEVAEASVASTDSANDALVAMESDAFDAMANEDWVRAQSILASPEYEKQKAIYSQGMAVAFEHFESKAAQITLVLKYSLILLQLFALLCAFIIFNQWRQYLIQNQLIEQKRHEYEVFRITMTTVMDTYNNALNNLIYIKMKAESNAGNIDKDDLMLFEKVIDESSAKLQAMGEMQEFKAKEEGSFQVLDYNKQRVETVNPTDLKEAQKASDSR